MKHIVFKAHLVAFCVFVLGLGAAAQDAAKDDRQKPTGQASHSSAGATAAKVPVVIVGSAAKATWVTTKFTTKYVVAPVAKEIFLEMTPAMAKFAAKNALRYGVPIAAKWALL